MFGYVIADINRLSPEEKLQYRSYYCGLCMALGKRHGTKSRITLTYDMTFLVLFLAALYKKDYKTEIGRCMVHPAAKYIYRQNEFTDYAADMNVALAYYNFIDDWNDDRKILPLFKARLFEKEYKRITAKYPAKTTIISQCLGELSAIEKAGVINPDIPANCFGKLMGEIFVPKEDEYGSSLRKFGKSLGKFIYIMDACVDLEEDLRKEQYNPMVATPSENFDNILNLLIADCTEQYNRLPINQDRSLVDNILYSGIWTRYEAEKKKAKVKR